jgi:hypothetical protein
MKHALIVTTITICIGTAASTAGALAAATAPAGSDAGRGGPPCAPKLIKIRGHQAVVNCGPATATVQMSGKTYTFRNGFCSQSKAAGSALQLDLGTLVTGVKDNAGQPDFSMLIAHAPSVASVFHASYGGRKILGDSLIKVSGNLPAKGAFTSSVTIGAKFTGSWDCHGTVWSAP